MQFSHRARSPRSARLIMVLAVAGGGLCAPAVAQNALGDGRALDANPRVGSGGRNPSRANTIANIARYNNAVVTGNAGAGKAFQGYVGYLAPDDFRASLGSNDLYTFQRDSASGAAVAQGIRGTDALRYQFGLVTGQAPPSFLGAAEATGATLVTQRSGTSGLAQGAALRSTSDYLTQRSLSPTVIGYRAEQDGSRFALTASPLLGVTMKPISGPTQGTGAEEAGSRVLPGLPTPGVTPGAAPGGADKVDPGKTRRTSILTGIEASRPGLTSTYTVAEMLDQTASAAKVDTRVSAPSAVLDPFTKALPPEKRATIPGGTPDEAGDGKPAWMRDLDRLRENLKSGGDRNRLDRPREGEKPGDGGAGDPDAPDGEAGGARPGGLTLDEIRRMTQPDLEKIDRDVARALAAARPLLDRLSPEKPTDNTAYNEHMAAGEQQLGEGKYFDAEDRFLRALAASPGDPMANLGRVHAQLGAGLYLSAAMNLHTLLQEHPEMIGTRYARALLPGQKRAEQIAQQMRQSIRATRTLLGKDAALLLAYLGYQRDDRAMLEEGVRAFAERTAERDTADRMLLALMQRVWVDGGSTEPAAGEPTAPVKQP